MNTEGTSTNPVGLGDLTAQHPAPLPWPVIIVIGAPRSGTSWLHQMLAEHPAVAGLGATELTLFSRYLSPWSLNFQRERADLNAGRWTQGLPVLFSDEEFERILLRMTGEVYARTQAHRPGATHVIDKHPNYSNHIPLIDRLVPSSRFIHIIRDGREVAVSMMSAQRRIGHSPGEVRGAAREWHRCITNARKDGAALGPDRYLELRYEDLVRDTAAGLRACFDFCGLPVDDGFVHQLAAANNIAVKQVSGGDATLNTLRRTPGAIWKTKLGLHERLIFHRMAGGLLEQLGYAEANWWAVRPIERVKVLPYGFAQRVKRSLRALHSTWTNPVEERLP